MLSDIDHHLPLPPTAHIFPSSPSHSGYREAGPEEHPSLPDPQPDCFLMLWLHLPCGPVMGKEEFSFIQQAVHCLDCARALQRVQAQSLVSEPRPYMLNCGQNLKQDKTKGQTDMRSSSLGPQRILSQPSAFRQRSGLLDK